MSTCTPAGAAVFTPQGEKGIRPFERDYTHHIRIKNIIHSHERVKPAPSIAHSRFKKWNFPPPVFHLSAERSEAKGMFLNPT